MPAAWQQRLDCRIRHGCTTRPPTRFAAVRNSGGHGGGMSKSFPASGASAASTRNLTAAAGGAAGAIIETVSIATVRVAATSVVVP